MRKTLHLLYRHAVFAFLVLLSVPVSAQTFTISGGTSGNHLYNLVYTWYQAPRVQRMATHIPASQLYAGGMPSGVAISSLELERGSGSGSTLSLPPGANVKIYLENRPSTSADLGSGSLAWNVSNATLVFDGDPSSILGSSPGWKQFVFGTGSGAASNFNYTGGAIVIWSEYIHTTGIGGSTAIPMMYATSSQGTPTPNGWTSNSTKYTNDASTTLPASLSSSSANHPHLKLNYLTGPCSVPPTAGTLSAGALSTICAGTQVNLALTGNSFGSGQTYQLESSSSASGPWTPEGTPSTSPPVVVNPMVTTYYRVAVTCGSSTVYSNSVQVSVAPLYPGGTYTINKNQPTGGTNFASFTDAIAAVRCGVSGAVTFNVTPGSGPYNEQVIIPQIGGVDAANPLTINGNGETITYGSTNTNERATIKLDGADYVIIDSLRIIAVDSTYGYALQLTNDADHNIIRNSYIMADSTSTSSNYGALVISGSATSATATGSNSDSNLIRHNVIEGGYYGITQNTSDGNRILDNTIRNFYYYGVYSNTVSNSLIENNDIHRPTRTSVSVFAGVYQTGAASNNQIIANRIHDGFGGEPGSTSAAYPIYLSSSDATAGNETRVFNNAIYNINGGGTIYALYNSGSDYVQYYHNTITLDDASYSGSSAARGLYQTTSAAGIDVKNNIFSVTRGGSGANYGIYKGTAATVMTSDYNDFYINGSGSNYVGYWGSNQATLANWQSASSQDAGSLDIDPLFVNALNGDLTPANGTLDNKGTPVGVTTDISGAARDATTPDIGAFEFAVPPCNGVPVAGTAFGIASVCAGQSFTLTDTGFTIASGLIFQWEYSPAGLGMWDTIAGANTPVYTVSAGISQPMDYRFTVTCVNGGAVDVSNVVSVGINPPTQCYCTPATTSTSYYIANFSTTNGTKNISNLGSGYSSGGYGNFAATDTVSAAPFGSFDFNGSFGSSPTYTFGVKIWIDWNQNGDFSDAGEEVFATTGYVSSVNGTITVPATALTGPTRMRVGANYSSSTGPANACANFSNGEYEDYTLDVLPPPSCYKPNNPVQVTATTTTADLSWEQSISTPAGGYEWRAFTLGNGPSGTPVDAGFETAGDTMTTVTGLTACNQYTFYVRAICGAGDSSIWEQVDFSTAAAGGTFTINKNQPTGGTNFASFNDAVSHFSCGLGGPVILNVVAGSGPYNEQVIIPQLTGSSATNTLTINGNGETITYGSTNTNERATIKLDGADYVIIDSLRIIAVDSTYGYALQLTNDADHNIIRNSYIMADSTSTSSNYGALVISGSATSATATGSNSDSNLIRHNVIEGGYYGITQNTSDGNRILDNTIRNFYYYGVYSNTVSNSLIENNDIHRPTRTSVSVFAGVYQTGAASNNQIIANRIHDGFGGEPGSTSAAYPIYLSSSDATAGNETRVFNNAIYNINGGGTIYALYNSGSDYVQYYHNTITLDDASYSGSSAARGLYQTTSAAGIDVKNNIFSVTRGGSGANYGIYKGTAATVMTSDYNDFYINGSGSNYVGYWGSNQATLANWQSASSQDAGSLDIDPLFVNALNGDLTPANGTLDNKGTPVGVTTDISGAARDATTPDIGAFEFAVPPCNGVPVAGTAFGIASVCAGQSFTLTDTGFTVASGLMFMWESSPAGLGMWDTISGANTPVYTVSAGISQPMDYRFTVTCVNGGAVDVSNVISVGMSPFYDCYCSPLTGVTLHGSTNNYITRVQIPGTTLDNPTTAVGPGGHLKTDPSVPSQTAVLTQGQSYTLEVTTSTASATSEVWIDWDQSGTFDPSEHGLISGGTLSTLTFTVPVTAVPGLTGMRVRNLYSTTTHFNDTGACANISLGRETEDYIITVNVGVQCSGTPVTAGTAVISKDTICNGGDVDLSVSGYPLELGLDIAWESAPAGSGNWTPVTGASGDNYTATGLTANTDFRAAVTCTNPGGGTAYSNMVTVTVNNPQITATYPGSSCSTGPVVLAATAEPGATINWYDVATGGTALGSGGVFVTPAITATTTYYAAATTEGGSGSVGPLNPASVGSISASAYAIGTYYMTFDVVKPTTLISVDVFPTAALNTNAALEIRDNNGNTLVTVPYTVTATGGTTPQTIPINFSLPVGTGYRLGQAATAINLNRNTSGAVYPYTSPVINITGNNFNVAYLYYFYNWQFSSGCEGVRVPVTATVNSAATGTGLASGGSITVENQADGSTVSYEDQCSEKIAAVTDASGGNVLGTTTAAVVTLPGVQVYGSTPYVPRIHDITPSSDGPGTVTIYALQSEFDAYNTYVTANNLNYPLLPVSGSDAAGMGNIVVSQFHGRYDTAGSGPLGLYDVNHVALIPNSSITAVSNGTYWTLTFPVSGFSGFFIHTGSAPLPIRLEGFTALYEGSRTRLQWHTSLEARGDYFEVERSLDGIGFERLGTVSGKGSAASYTYYDTHPVRGKNYYRLKLVEASGQSLYSAVREVVVKAGGEFSVRAYPNPVSDVLTVKAYGTEERRGTVTISDVTGKVMEVVPVTDGSVSVQMQGYAAGVYFIKYQDAGHSQTLKVTRR